MSWKQKRTYHNMSQHPFEGDTTFAALLGDKCGITQKGMLWRFYLILNISYLNLRNFISSYSSIPFWELHPGISNIEKTIHWNPLTSKLDVDNLPSDLQATFQVHTSVRSAMGVNTSVHVHVFNWSFSVQLRTQKWQTTKTKHIVYLLC